MPQGGESASPVLGENLRIYFLTGPVNVEGWCTHLNEALSVQIANHAKFHFP